MCEKRVNKNDMMNRKTKNDMMNRKTKRLINKEQKVIFGKIQFS